MANLLQETLDALNVETIDEAVKLILWAKVCDTEKEKMYILPPENTDTDVREFLNSMNGEYNPNDYLRQIVFGTIMLVDGTWLEHSDCGWTHRSMPEF